MTETTRPTVVQEQQLKRYTALLQLVVIVVLAALAAVFLWAVFERAFWENLSQLIVLAFVYVSVIAAVQLPGRTATLEVGDKSAFASRVDMATSTMGYAFATQTEDVYVYEPTVWKAHMFAWPVSVYLHGRQAVIVGPKRSVRILLERLAEA